MELKNKELNETVDALEDNLELAYAESRKLKDTLKNVKVDKNQMNEKLDLNKGEISDLEESMEKLRLTNDKLEKHEFICDTCSFEFESERKFKKHTCRLYISIQQIDTSSTHTLSFLLCTHNFTIVSITTPTPTPTTHHQHHHHHYCYQSYFKT